LRSGLAGMCKGPQRLRLRQLVLFRVLRWADSDSVFLWERARLLLGTRILAMATYHRCDPCWCSPPPPRYLHLTCTGFAQPLARMTDKPLTSNNLQNTDSNFTCGNRIKEEMEAFPEKF
uniref:Uncharacterized protein n=1 Tax=Panthera leo TaxID=9689 RepID=A0A8C8WG79_PANLE